MMNEKNESLTEKPNRKEQRRIETRGKLLNSALALISEKGIDNTSMTDITEHANLGRRTFYYHFAGKDECLVIALAGVYQNIAREAATQPMPNQDPAKLVAISMQQVLGKIIVNHITQRFLERPKLLRQALQLSIGPFVANDVKIGIEQSRFFPAITGKLLEDILMGILALLISETGKKPEDIPLIINGLTKMFLMMLGVDKTEAEVVVEEVLSL
jgi:AcrR family transcriptional regulator